MKRIFTIVLIILPLAYSCKNGGKNQESGGVNQYAEENMRFLENERVKLGIDLSLGGAVTYLSDSENGGKNMINSYDWGRQIQLSYYSGPWPYIGPKGENPSDSWAGLGWNPIQSGDAGGNRSQIIEFEFRGENCMYVKCVPMQWPHTEGVKGECNFECLYTLDGHVFTMEATINIDRHDKTQYQACTQEMPALYTNGPWYKLVTYLGDEPFQNKPATTIVDKNDGKGWPWVHFYSPEQWAALLDESGKGIGVFQPDATTFNAGFHGGDATKGRGGEKDGQTGHIAPTQRQILDHNISWTYKTAFVLGTIDDIRQYAEENRKIPAQPEWIFENQRHGWYYEGGANESGWPVESGLNVSFAKNSRATSPVTFWKAGDAPFLELEAAFESANPEITLEITIQPVAKSDFTDWLNWSEGNHSAEREKQEKASQSPSMPAFQIKEKIQSDGNLRKYRIDLAASADYRGAMKKLSIGVSDEVTAKIKSIKLCR